MLNKLRQRLRALFFKSRLEEELDEEVRFHLERETQKSIWTFGEPGVERKALHPCQLSVRPAGWLFAIDKQGCRFS
jgi:hypothetical protein